MKAYKKILIIITSVIAFLGVWNAVLSNTTSSSTKNVTNILKISTMSKYKEMSYDFLKTYDFGGTNKSKSAYTFDSVTQLKESLEEFEIGKYITTKGYYKIGDLGGATYLVSQKADTYGAIQLKNGLYVNLVPDTFTDKDNTKWIVVSVKQFGTTGDGKTADNISINDTISFTNSYTKLDEYDRAIVYMPKGEYKAIDQIHANVSNINLIGEGDSTVIFTDNDYRIAGGAEFFFQSDSAKNNYFASFKLDARQIDWYRYIRQMMFTYCENVYLYNITLNVPDTVWTASKGAEDIQYTNLTIYTGDKKITVDECTMNNMAGTYRGANIGIMDFWKAGTEDIVIMNSIFHDNARDEQFGIFSNDNTEESYVKNVDFINNEIHLYEYPHKDIYRDGRSLSFTVSYTNSNIDNIHIAGNHFIAEVDSTFMTFGNATNILVEDNIFEIKSSYGARGYVFNSSNPNSDNVQIRNNEFYLTYKDGVDDGKVFSTGRMTLTNNKIVTDSRLSRISDKFGVYRNNVFNLLGSFSTVGAVDVFNNNEIHAYQGHSSSNSDGILFILNQGAVSKENFEYIGNTVNDYTYFYGDKAKEKTFDRLSTINAIKLDKATIMNNTYNAPNYKYIKDNDYIYISRYNGANVNDLIIKDNNFQGAKGVYQYSPIDNFDNLNTYREFTMNPQILNENTLIKSINITENGKIIDKEITTSKSSLNLDKIVKNAADEIVLNKDIEWVTSIESIATVSNGTVTRNKYGSVYVYATSKDGSGVYDRIKVNFVQHTEHAGGTSTCTKKAICEVCSKEYGDLNPNNHNLTTIHKENQKNATCKEEGYTGDKLYDCCNKIKEKGTVIEKSAHKYDEAKITKQANYEQEGEKTYTCIVCNETKIEKIPKLNKQPDNKDNKNYNNVDNDNNEKENNKNKPGDSNNQEADKTQALGKLPQTGEKTNLGLWITILILIMLVVSSKLWKMKK